MSQNPNIPGNVPTLPGLSDVEAVMLANLNRAFTGMSTLYKIIRSPKVNKAVKNSTKLFKSIREAGKSLKGLTDAFEMTKSLIAMPGRTATQGLDAMGAQLIAPITGAITQAIGQANAMLMQTLGPALQKIGAAVGGFVKEQPIGAGIGGMVGGIAGKITGIPGLGIAGGLIGAGVEAIFNINKPKGDTPEDMSLRIRNYAGGARDQFGWSYDKIYSEMRKGSNTHLDKALDFYGITSADQLKAFMGDTGDGDAGLNLAAVPAIFGAESVSGVAVSTPSGAGGTLIQTGGTALTNDLLRRMLQLQTVSWS